MSKKEPASVYILHAIVYVQVYHNSMVGILFFTYEGNMIGIGDDFYKKISISFNRDSCIYLFQEP